MTLQSEITSPLKRAPDRDRRSEILVAAQKAFVRHGFHAATMIHVADEAGMSAGNLYRYFPSKEAIVEGLCLHDQEERASDFAALTRSLSIFDAISFGLRERLLARSSLKARMILEIWAEGGRNPRIAEIGRAMDEEVRLGLNQVFAAAQARSEASSEMDPSFAADVFRTLVGGLFKRMAHEANFDAAKEAALALGVVRALFEGKIRPEPIGGDRV